MAKSVREFLTEMGANKVETTPYKPTSNGSVERFHAYLAQPVEGLMATHDEVVEHDGSPSSPLLQDT